MFMHQCKSSTASWYSVLIFCRFFLILFAPARRVYSWSASDSAQSSGDIPDPSCVEVERTSSIRSSRSKVNFVEGFAKRKEVLKIVRVSSLSIVARRSKAYKENSVNRSRAVARSRRTEKRVRTTARDGRRRRQTRRPTRSSGRVYAPRG